MSSPKTQDVNQPQLWAKVNDFNPWALEYPRRAASGKSKGKWTGEAETDKVCPQGTLESLARQYTPATATVAGQVDPGPLGHPKSPLLRFFWQTYCSQYWRSWGWTSYGPPLNTVKKKAQAKPPGRARDLGEAQLASRLMSKLGFFETCSGFSPIAWRTNGAPGGKPGAITRPIHFAQIAFHPRTFDEFA